MDPGWQTAKIHSMNKYPIHTQTWQGNMALNKSALQFTRKTVNAQKIIYMLYLWSMDAIFTSFPKYVGDA